MPPPRPLHALWLQDAPQIVHVSMLGGMGASPAWTHGLSLFSCDEQGCAAGCTTSGAVSDVLDFG